MIVCTQKETAFVHVPKCAGMSVRRQIERYHDITIDFWGVGQHPDVGEVDLAHLPLSAVKDLHPDVYEQLKTCSIFALVREPAERFRSATAQHLNNFHNTTIHTVSDEYLRDVAWQISVRIAGTNGPLPNKLSHFVRQADMVPNDGSAMDCRLYRFEDLPLMIEDLGRRLGTTLDAQWRVNRSTPLRYERLRRPLRSAHRQLRRIFPARYVEQINRRATQILAQKQNTISPVFKEDWLVDFIVRHYARDIALYNSLPESTAGARAIH